MENRKKHFPEVSQQVTGSARLSVSWPVIAQLCAEANVSLLGDASSPTSFPLSAKNAVHINSYLM